MKWKPVFSQLLETKAALLEATAPQSDTRPTPTPLLKPDSGSPSQDNPSSSAQNHLLKLRSLLQTSKNQGKTPAHCSLTQKSQEVLSPITTLPTQMETQQDELGATQLPLKLKWSQAASAEPDQAAASHTQTKEECHASLVAPRLQVTVAQDEVSSDFPVANQNKPGIRPLVPLASVPLIRSKTGRIILPSSLKPSKLMVTYLNFPKLKNVIVFILFICFSFSQWVKACTPSWS